MATNTYVALRQTTITGSPTSSVTFDLTGITGYTDLVAVINAKVSASSYDLSFRLNSDTGSNYSWTTISGNGSVVTTTRGSNLTAGRADYRAYMDTTNFNTYILNFMNYSNATTYKNVLVRGNSAALGTDGLINLWRNTNAITSIVFAPEFTGNFAVGSTFSLYGIAAEATTPAPKATGGAIYSDSLYYYHVFGSTGVFTPTQSISADVLCIAGGGGSGRTGGGGGAGGLRALTSQSMTTTAYTVTIGAGGTGATTDGSNATNGGNSSFAGSGFTTITASGGGGGSSFNGGGTSIGSSGGSGGGGGTNDGTNYSRVGGSGNAGSYSPVEGYAGGNGVNSRGSGGGGGAGGVGTNAPSTNNGGAGGVGSSAYSSWGIATGTGENVSGTYYYAGGGGGSTYQYPNVAGGAGGGGAGGPYQSNSKNAIANTGGGAGSNNDTNGFQGGSGIVIVRYAKA
jgi:hypothetical protein